MIQRSVINKASKIRMLKFSNSFFSKRLQWYIEHYSTEATICHFQQRLDEIPTCIQKEHVQSLLNQCLAESIIFLKIVTNIHFNRFFLFSSVKSHAQWKKCRSSSFCFFIGSSLYLAVCLNSIA